ncbi:MAG: hypothetical protein QNJ51_08420 [Calothrix sp. MO_167.B12]|nr:hypothetical protein [Calothrix sp. MO_167.B12]
MSTLQNFGFPAFQQDFDKGSSEDQELVALWTTNVTGWINQAIVGNPWNVMYASEQTFFYNPRYTDIPDGTAAAQITWFAFPNRLKQYLETGASPANIYNLQSAQILRLADTGYYQTPEVSANSFQSIPVEHSDLCPQVNWNSDQDNWQIYGPYGPRGWQDEYCEWSVTQDSSNNIIRVDFVCENPEYWYNLWKIDPEKVRTLYEDTLNYQMPSDQQISVALEDLQLTVNDPETGQPAYNPLNKWNCGPVSVRTGDSSNFSGGAMHLTSTPNTLQTELGLAGAATVQRTIGNNSPQELICCSQYGQNYRNSDPNIGVSVNRVVQGMGTPNIACLADPVGLYIQMPNFASYTVSSTVTLPEGATVADCWQIVRGEKVLTDPVTGEYFPGEYSDEQYQGVGNFILHAVFQIPQEWQDLNSNSLTLSDILIGGQPIEWAGQIAQTFKIALYARPISASNTPSQLSCVSTPADSSNQPLQLMYKSLWDAYYAINEPNPADQNLPLVSNTTFVVTTVEQGQSSIEIALTYSPSSDSPPIPTVEFSTVNDQDPIGNQDVDSNITATVVGGPTPVNYAVPGNSYPSDSYVLFLTLNIGSSAELGLRGVRITDPSQTPAPFVPALLNVVASS